MAEQPDATYAAESVRHDDLRRAAYATRMAIASWGTSAGDDLLTAHPGRSDVTTSALNRLSDLAARLLGTESAQVSLIASEQHVVGGVGVAADAVGGQSPAEDSLCTVTTRARRPLLVTDAPADPRVSDLPPVTSGAVGAYLGVPLVARNGLTVGALCAFGPTARDWSERDVDVLETLAGQVVTELELAVDMAEARDDRMVWRLAVDAAGVGVFDWHLPTDQLRWDERLLELFGHDRETFGGNIEAFNACLHPEDLPRVGAALQEAIRTTGSFESEYRVVWPTGEVRWIAARGHALAGPDGEAIKFVGAAYDTTVVKEGDVRVARVLETMPTAFFQLDPEWRFSFVNGEAERLLETGRADLLGGNVWELFPAAVGTIFEERYRQAMRTREPVAFDAYYPPPFDGWYEVRAWPSLDGLAVYVTDISARHRAQEQLDFAAQRSEILARLSGALTSTLDIDEAVSTLGPLLAPALADWCLVTVAADPHAAVDWRLRLHDVGFWHPDPERRRLVERYAAARLSTLTDDSFVAQALDSESPLVIPSPVVESILAVMGPGGPRELLTDLAPASAVVVPLRGRGRVAGLLTLFRDADRPGFSPEDLTLLEDIGVRAGLAMDNARLFGQQREVAETLQRSLLSEPRHHADLDVAVRYEPAADATQVGGDWYDSFLQDDGSTLVVIGDVVGHDISAAAVMGQIRSLVRGIAFHTSEGPAALMRGVDRAMVGLEEETTATAVIARLDRNESGPGTQRLQWSNAGHPPPMLLRADGTVETLERPEADLLLGLAPDVGRQEHHVDLSPGDTVLFYTDGLVERRIAGIESGLGELSRMLHDLGPERSTEEIAERVLRGLMPYEADDDVAVLVLRLRPS